MEQNDSFIRLEIIKIAAGSRHPTYGVMEVLRDAELLYNFVKIGVLPEPEGQRFY